MNVLFLFHLEPLGVKREPRGVVLDPDLLYLVPRGVVIPFPLLVRLLPGIANIALATKC